MSNYRGMKFVYISGPYRANKKIGVSENIHNARKVGYKVADLGAFPIVPHNMALGFEDDIHDDFWLDGLLDLVIKCDAVVMVEGWQQSDGSIKEMEVALRNKIPVFDDLFKLREWLAKS